MHGKMGNLRKCRCVLEKSATKSVQHGTVLQEAPLSHSPRSMVFIDAETVCFGYLPVDYALFSLKTRTTTEISIPGHAGIAAAGISSMGMGAFSGLGGYIGLGSKPKPCVLRIDDGEALIAKDSESEAVMFLPLA